MSTLENLREWRELGLQVQQRRERVGLSTLACAEQLSVSPQTLIDLESANVFNYLDQGSFLPDLARQYLELLELSLKPYASLLLNASDSPSNAESIIPEYLKAK